MTSLKQLGRGSRALLEQDGEGPVGKEQSLPRLSRETRVSSPCPLMASNPWAHILSKLRVFSPIPPARHLCLCLTTGILTRANQLLDSLSPAQALLPKCSFRKHPQAFPPLRASYFTPRMLEAWQGPRFPRQVKEKSRTLCCALGPVSSPRPSSHSPPCTQVPVRHRLPSPACPHPRCGSLPT